MAEIRRRKGGKNKGGGGGYKSYAMKYTNGLKSEKHEAYFVLGMSLQDAIVMAIGIGMGLYMGYRHGLYMNQLHENNLWFSNIKVTSGHITAFFFSKLRSLL